jgi:minor extracellular serine protease Vpr
MMRAEEKCGRFQKGRPRGCLKRAAKNVVTVGEEYMQFTSTRVAASLALAFGILGSSTSHAVRPEAVEGVSQRVTPVAKPLALAKKQVTVVVQLAGASVAEQQADAGRKLSRDEKDRVKEQLRGQQDAVRPQIESRGGTVLANYRAAYNGIKVRIASDRVAELATLPGVVAVRTLQLQKPNNIHGIPFIGAPAVWDGARGLHGEGVKIAIIDTGIDYTHANFGGPGTAAAYVSAHTHETAPADPNLFGLGAPRVKGGIDLVGDSYDADPQSATYQPVPHPDPNPLDCNGHGSHVAGTAAGSGVLSTGATYSGSYNATTVSANSWNVGPGVAPKADIYSIRVFGCNGSTDVTVDAIEWAVDHDMDVINMSLGSPFGEKDDPSAVASTNAARAGVIVVASAGNSGTNQYIQGSPASADGAISVAANDPTQTFPAALINLATITAIDANGATLPSGSFPVKVLRSGSAVSLGCNPAEYAGTAGMIVVTARGSCARVARAIFGEQHGAAAVVMINNAAGYPPYEGPITSNPDTGEPFNVTIPFLGVQPSDQAKLLAAEGGSTTLTASMLINPGFKRFASFTSGGPRIGDSALKPDITAPGVSIASTFSGSGNLSEFLSGTSMAAPHVTGAAALTRQAHPDWKVEDIKAAIVGTGDPGGVAGYSTRVGGSGLVQPGRSTVTQVVAHVGGQRFGSTLNFGFAEFNYDFHKSLDITLRNLGGVAATFDVAQANAAGRTHSVSFSTKSVTVPANGEATLTVTLDVPVATAGRSNGSGLSYQDVAGLVAFTPRAGDNSGAAVRVPYYLVPRAQADVATSLGRMSGSTAVATVTNKNGGVAGDADFYAWGLLASKITGQGHNDQPHDIRAVGVQSFPEDAATQFIAFAVNTYNRWSSASTVELDVYVDVDGDGKDDYLVVGYDFGQLTAGAFDGRYGSFVFSLNPSSTYASINYFAAAPTDSSTALLFIDSSQLCPGAPDPCLSAANPQLTYRAESINLLNGDRKVVPGTAKFNAWTNAISFGNGGFTTVKPGATDTSVTVSVNPTQAAKTPALGVMVVTLDNQSGADEAQLIPLK